MVPVSYCSSISQSSSTYSVWSQIAVTWLQDKQSRAPGKHVTARFFLLRLPTPSLQPLIGHWSVMDRALHRSPLCKNVCGHLTTCINLSRRVVRPQPQPAAPQNYPCCSAAQQPASGRGVSEAKGHQCRPSAFPQKQTRSQLHNTL